MKPAPEVQIASPALSPYRGQAVKGSIPVPERNGKMIFAELYACTLWGNGDIINGKTKKGGLE